MEKKGYFSRPTFLLFYLLFFLGIFFRIYRLGYDDLWFDEAHSVLVSSNLSWIHKSFGPPLYSFIMHFWLSFGKRSEFFIRFPSFVFAAFSLLGIKKIADYIWKREYSSLISLAILALSPLHIWYAQEARRYTLSVLLCVFILLYFLKALREDRKLYWFIFAVLSALGFYSDYFLVLFFLPESLTVLYKKDRGLLKRWFSAKMITAVLCLPWLLFLIKDIKFVSDIFWPAPVTWRSLIITLANFNLGFTSTPVGFYSSLIVVAAILAVALIHSKIKKDGDEYFLLFVMFFMLPVIMVFIAAYLRYNIYFSRALMVFSIPYYLVLSYAIWLVLKKRMYVLVVLLFLLNLSSLFNYYKRYIPSPVEYHTGVYIKKPVRPVVEYIKGKFEKDDIVIHTNIQTPNIFAFYGDDKYRTNSIYLVTPEQDTYFRKIFLNYKGKGAERIMGIENFSNLNFKRAWVVLSSWDRDGTLDENSLSARKFLEENYAKISSRWFDGILVELYE